KEELVISMSCPLGRNEFPPHIPGFYNQGKLVDDRYDHLSLQQWTSIFVESISQEIEPQPGMEGWPIQTDVRGVAAALAQHVHDVGIPHLTRLAYPHPFITRWETPRSIVPSLPMEYSIVWNRDYLTVYLSPDLQRLAAKKITVTPQHHYTSELLGVDVDRPLPVGSVVPPTKYDVGFHLHFSDAKREGGVSSFSDCWSGPIASLPPICPVPVPKQDTRFGGLSYPNLQDLVTKALKEVNQTFACGNPLVFRWGVIAGCEEQTARDLAKHIQDVGLPAILSLDKPAERYIHSVRLEDTEHLAIEYALEWSTSCLTLYLSANLDTLRAKRIDITPIWNIDGIRVPVKYGMCVEANELEAKLCPFPTLPQTGDPTPPC
ncbi:MAG: hypothetical protein KDK78_03245, partial [Chlamydiia bacterium]|nr:hypothetical protein [Chlamydiia bacterium]